MPPPARRVLFVCTANLVRSPMAAAFAEQIALERSWELQITSAGTHAVPGRPAEPRVVAVCRERGLDLSGHTSRRLTAEDVRAAERIFVMEPAHALFVRELAPELGEVVFGLGPYVGEPLIADPIGSWFKGPFRRTRDELERAVRRALG